MPDVNFCPHVCLQGLCAVKVNHICFIPRPSSERKEGMAQSRQKMATCSCFLPPKAENQLWIPGKAPALQLWTVPHFSHVHQTRHAQPALPPGSAVAVRRWLHQCSTVRKCWEKSQLRRLWKAILGFPWTLTFLLFNNAQGSTIVRFRTVEWDYPIQISGFNVYILVCTNIYYQSFEKFIQCILVIFTANLSLISPRSTVPSLFNPSSTQLFFILRNKLAHSRLLGLWFLQSFCPLHLPHCPLSFKCRDCVISVVIGDQHQL